MFTYHGARPLYFRSASVHVTPHVLTHTLRRAQYVCMQRHTSESCVRSTSALRDSEGMCLHTGSSARCASTMLPLEGLADEFLSVGGHVLSHIKPRNSASFRTCSLFASASS